MEYSKAELERRRKRGAAAQSAFRKRQAQAKRDMEDENAALKQAIRAILSEVRAEDRIVLQQKINAAAAVAGLNHGTRHNEISIPTPASSLGNPTVTPPQGQIDQTSNFGDSELRSNTSVKPPVSRQESESAQGCDRSSATKSSSHLSIHQDPFQRHQCSNWYASTLPFLGAGAFTFAGRIFWHLVEKFEATNASSLRLTSPVTPKPPHVNIGPSHNHQELSVRTVEPKNWSKMIQAYRSRQGEEVARSDFNAPPSMQLPQKPFVEPETTYGVKFSLEWLSPMSAEQRIRTVVGDDVFATLAAPLLQHWEAEGTKGGRLAENHSAVLIEGFLDWLSESYTCFGDGPRWDIETFDTALREWCLSVINNQISASAS